MSEGTAQEQMIARAIKDSAFRQALLTNPRSVLALEDDFHLPKHVARRGRLEEPPNTFTLCCLPGTSGHILLNE